MEYATIVMNTGTWLLALAAIPQIMSIWNNRKDLRGYSKIASATLLLGILLIDISFIIMKDYISMTAGLIQILMWLMATMYAKGS